MRALPHLLGLMVLAGCGPKAPEVAKNEAPAAASAPAAPRKGIGRGHAGEAPPTAEFLDPDGETATLAEFEGKPLLVNLWATWCAPCVAELPTLDALAASDKRIQVLAVSEDGDEHAADTVERFLAEHKLGTIEAYRDRENALMGALRVEVLPTSILFDAKGREVWRITGEEAWGSPKAKALIEEALKR